jgi:hypothetical protein
VKPALSIRRKLASLVALTVAIMALIGAPAAPGDTVAPPITLGPVTVANGLAIVSGTVAGTSPSSASLTINGQPLSIGADGRFAGTVNLGGQSSLSFAVRNHSTGDVITVNVPLTLNIVGPGGVISPTVLSSLEQAAVEVTKPVGGFLSIDGQPITVSGSVGDRDQLAGLTVNGIDVMSTLKPDGTFTAPIPGTTRTVSVRMVDRAGTSQTVTYPVSPVTSNTVSAADALGVRVASVRYFPQRTRSTKRLRMLVTIKDRRGLFVRGATVTVRSANLRRVIGRTKMKRTGKLGQVGFVMRLRPNAFRSRFFTVTTAKTPKAKASRRTSVRFPRLATRASARR